MAKLNRVCCTCGQKYSYCTDCYEDRYLETWHIMFHDENCKKIFNIINKHFYKHITTEEAIKMLKACDLSNLSDLNDDIQRDIKNIMSQEVKEEVISKKTEYKTHQNKNKSNNKNKK